MLLGETAQSHDAGDFAGQRGGDLGCGRVHPRGDMTGKAHRLERGVKDSRHGAGTAAHREQGAPLRGGPHHQSLGAEGCADLLHLGRAGPVVGGVLGRGEVVVVGGRTGRRDRRDLLAQPRRILTGQGHIDVEDLRARDSAQAGHVRRELRQLTPEDHPGHRVRRRAGRTGADHQQRPEHPGGQRHGGHHHGPRRPRKPCPARRDPADRATGDRATGVRATGVRATGERDTKDEAEPR